MRLYRQYRSLTIYIQKDSPGKALESNWLPAPNDTVYLVMRLYYPKETPPSILPPGEGTWKPQLSVSGTPGAVRLDDVYQCRSAP
jgi:hypothetical protein